MRNILVVTAAAAALFAAIPACAQHGPWYTLSLTGVVIPGGKPQPLYDAVQPGPTADVTIAIDAVVSCQNTGNAPGTAELT